MGPNYRKITKYNFESQDWTSFYGDVQQAIPINSPTSQGKSATIGMMVYSDHARDVDDRRSGTGYMINVLMS